MKLKRGYWKWTDENGVRHKVKEAEMLLLDKEDGEDETVSDGDGLV